MGKNQQGKIGISHSGCLGHCSYETKNDIDEIIEQHLLKQKIVHRLLLPNEK